jgi:FtsZ-binding cell division protein ZapB
LNLSKYTFHKENAEYTLYGIVNHHGSSLECGNYTAHVLNNDDWYHIDKLKCIKVDESKIVTNNAYVLFYKHEKQQNFQQEIVHLQQEIFHLQHLKQHHQQRIESLQQEKDNLKQEKDDLKQVYNYTSIKTTCTYMYDRKITISNRRITNFTGKMTTSNRRITNSTRKIIVSNKRRYHG